MPQRGRTTRRCESRGVVIVLGDERYAVEDVFVRLVPSIGIQPPGLLERVWIEADQRIDLRALLIEALNAIQIISNQLFGTYLTRVKCTAQLLDRGIGGTERIIPHGLHGEAQEARKYQRRTTWHSIQSLGHTQAEHHSS